MAGEVRNWGGEWAEVDEWAWGGGGAMEGLRRWTRWDMRRAPRGKVRLGAVWLAK